jgi:hypothetical protein
VSKYLDKLSNMYKVDEKQRLTYKEVDVLVKKFQASKTEQQENFYLQQLLKSFHNYFLKYVTLLKGTLSSYVNTDTAIFLSLFLEGRPKNLKSFKIIARQLSQICSSLEEDDTYNELVIMFIHLLNKFEFRGSTSFSHYVTKYMRWDIKQMIMKMFKNPINQNPVSWELNKKGRHLQLKSNNFHNQQSLSKRYQKSFYTEDTYDNGIYSELPKMDLSWVISPGTELFGILSEYERYLLYLNYKKNLGVRQISKKLGRAKDTIHNHIQHAMEKLRTHYKKGDN